MKTPFAAFILNQLSQSWGMVLKLERMPNKALNEELDGWQEIHALVETLTLMVSTMAAESNLYKSTTFGELQVQIDELGYYTNKILTDEE